MAKEKPQLSLFAKYYKNGKVVSTIRRLRKRSFLRQTEAKFRSDSINKVYILIKYNRHDYNDGVYENLADFKKAYEAFTEQALIEYLNPPIPDPRVHRVSDTNGR